MALTAKQSIFVQEYLKDLNATAAYKRAGYMAKGNSAEVQAHRLLRNPKIVELVAKAQQERSASVRIDAAYVLSRLGEIDQMDALDILEEDGSVKPIKEWPKIWRQMISGLDVMEIAGADDEKRLAIVKKIKWPDKIKNLELIGRHVGVQAFKDRIEHSGNIKGMAERMRRRVRQQ